MIFQGVVEKIVNGGWGLVRSAHGVVFLSYVLPGEEISYSIKEKAKGILWGETIRIITPAPERITPVCSYYGECGGCQLQHLDADTQRSLKKQLLIDTIYDQTKLKPDIENVISSPPFHYRIRAKLKPNRANAGIGFIKKSSNDVIPISHCHLIPEKMSLFLKKWNEQSTIPFFSQMDVLFNPDSEKIFGFLTPPPTKLELKFSEKFPDIQFSSKNNMESSISAVTIDKSAYFISPATFFQVNRFMWQPMLQLVEAMCPTVNKAIDLYSGVGFFLPVLQKNANTVIAVESDPLAVKLARLNFPTIKIFKTPAEKFCFCPADLILIDPPRLGISKIVMKNLLQEKFKSIVYISCLATTFARDLKILLNNGYELKKIQALDLFPQTPHLETIALLQRTQ
jgi:23S rRNA (uracil1939-C5)-methyltransferase